MSNSAPDKQLVIVRETGEGFFTVEVIIGPHNFKADEPKDFGGDDQGPGPYDLLLASLGSCTSMTLRMYARHKKLAVDKISVKLWHQKIHAEDCAECETKSGKIDLIEREIEIKGNLTKAQHKRMLEIADRCPVHRTLTEEVKIVTRGS